MRKNWFYLLVFFVFLAVIITFPAILTIKSKMIGDMGDGYQFIGFQYIAKKLFFSGQFPFGWTNFWRYPYGIDFQNSYDSTLLMIFGITFYQFINNPVLIYNLSIFSFIILSLAISYYSFNIFFESQIALIGSVIYGLTFYAIARLGGHINLFLIPSFLLFFVSIYKIYIEKGSNKSFVLLILSCLLIPFSSLQFPLLLVGSFPFLLILSIIFFRKELTEFFSIIWDNKGVVLASSTLIFILFFIFHGQKLLGLLNNQTQLPVNEITSVPFINFFIPNQYLATISSVIYNDTKSWIEYVVFFGYVEITLFIFALYKLKRTKIFWFLLIIFIIFFVISLGKQGFLPFIWPYQYLFPILPYRGIIEPGRFIVFSYLALTVLILLYLASIKNKKIIILIAAVLIFERLPLNFQLSPNLYDKNFIQALKNSPSKAVLQLPLYVDWFNGQYYDMYSVYSDKPMVNGYIQWSGNTQESQTLTKYMEEYTCYYDTTTAPTFFDSKLAEEKKNIILKTLVQYNIRTVVINHDLYFNDDRCIRARPFIEKLLEDKDRWQTIYYDGKKEILYLKN